eukprot:TRINITY_DN2855_c0_g1_i7.p1 TRINITY_DN2855_c0_g1~~TRINITY_DN2855_c0_g1_i7.p1  ORF type:complete len:466 (-),score=192.73 TRINITY_DN2855_c0_g1_i7:268-1665(-)
MSFVFGGNNYAGREVDSTLFGTNKRRTQDFAVVSQHAVGQVKHGEAAAREARAVEERERELARLEAKARVETWEGTPEQLRRQREAAKAQAHAAKEEEWKKFEADVEQEKSKEKEAILERSRAARIMETDQFKQLKVGLGASEVATEQAKQLEAKREVEQQQKSSSSSSGGDKFFMGESGLQDLERQREKERRAHEIAQEHRLQLEERERIREEQRRQKMQEAAEMQKQREEARAFVQTQKQEMLAKKKALFDQVQQQHNRFLDECAKGTQAEHDAEEIARRQQEQFETQLKERETQEEAKRQVKKKRSELQATKVAETLEVLQKREEARAVQQQKEMDDREATAVAERQRKQQQMKQIVAQERAAAIAMKQEREAHEAAENRRMRDIIVEQQRVAGDEDTRLKRLKHERAQALAESLRQQMAEKAALEKKETVFKQQEGREMSRAVSQERKEFAEFATGVVKGK